MNGNSTLDQTQSNKQTKKKLKGAHTGDRRQLLATVVLVFVTKLRILLTEQSCDLQQ